MWTGETPKPKPAASAPDMRSQKDRLCRRAFAGGSAPRAMRATSDSWQTVYSARARKVRHAARRLLTQGSHCLRALIASGLQPFLGRCVGMLDVGCFFLLKGVSWAVTVRSLMQIKIRPPTSARSFIRSVSLIRCEACELIGDAFEGTELFCFADRGGSGGLVRVQSSSVRSLRSDGCVRPLSPLRLPLDQTLTGLEIGT